MNNYTPELLARLTKTVKDARHHASSSFYTNKYAQTETADTCFTRDTFERLPFLTKKELIDTPLEERLFRPLSEVTSIRATSGTSNRGLLLFPRSGHVDRSFLAPYATKMFSHFFPYSGMDRSFALGNIGHLGFDMSLPEASVSMAKLYQPDGMTGPSTALIALVQMLLQEEVILPLRCVHLFGSRPAQSHYRFFSDHFPHARISWEYSSIEGNGISALPCEKHLEQKDNRVHVLPSHFIELIDTSSTVIDSTQTPGEMVLTTTFEGNPCPVIRYKTGDLAEWVESQCDCGTPSLRILGRVDFDRAYLPRGVLLATELEKALAPYVHAEGFRDDFEIHLTGEALRPSVTLYVFRLGNTVTDSEVGDAIKSVRVGPKETLGNLLEEGLLRDVTCSPLPQEKSAGRRVTRIVNKTQ